MGWGQAILGGLFGVSAIACLLALPAANKLSQSETRIGLLSVLIVSAIWAGTTALRLIVPVLQIDIVLYQIGLIAGLTSVVAWLYFASAYTGQWFHKSQRLQVSALVVIGLVTVIKLTNPVHNLYFSARTVAEPFPHTAIILHPLHWVVAGIAYSFVAVGLYMLYDVLAETEHDPQRLAVVIGATAAPAVFEVLAYAELVPGLRQIPHVSFSPVGMVVFVIGSFYYLERDFVTVPRRWRQQVLRELSESIIVLDKDGRIRDANAAAKTTFNDVVANRGRRLDQVAPGLARSIFLDQDLSDPSDQLKVSSEAVGADTRGPPSIDDLHQTQPWSDGGVATLSTTGNPDSVPDYNYRRISDTPADDPSQDSPSTVASGELVIERLPPSGEHEYFAVTTQPLSLGNDTEGVAIIFVDITTVENHRQQLLTQNERFDEFADAVTHEVRNAITLIHGNLHALDEEHSKETGQQTPVEDIENVLTRIEAVVDDLATLARNSKSLQDTQPVSVKQACRVAAHSAEVSEVTVEAQSDLKIEAVPSRVEELFRIVVDLTEQLDGNGVAVSTESGYLNIVLRGITVDQDKLPQAMEYGEPVPTTETGMLFPNIRLLAESHGWEMSMYTEQDRTVIVFSGVTTQEGQ